jgi:hypothetical protein
MRTNSNTVSGDYSFAFGSGVTVSNDYESAFYSTSHAGTVRITDVLILTPRSSAPATIEGTIYIDSSDDHIYCRINGGWRQLDN